METRDLYEHVIYALINLDFDVSTGVDVKRLVVDKTFYS